ncbi:MAG TPA: hypothetical protein ENO08_06665 [Candidatus Eisenbacteria bacterium]|uniref:Uncharacterized protein n=1 Tax=Eiseniibacteriota bacterium TaxID=2212470 RepID=A0A7V2AVN6_UNCEI|nr:hypothetical protein [Candidatus Eisenbacteria bacterium]
MAWLNEKKVLSAAVVLSSVSLFAPLPAPLLFVAGVIQSFILPGLVLFFLLGGRDRPWTDHIFMIPIFSPVLFTLTMLLALKLTGDLSVSLRLSAGSFYILFIICMIAGRDDLGRFESSVPAGAILLSICYGLLIAASYAANDLLLIRSDAWYHASVTNEILAGGAPPMEPWLPDQPIRYMWIYHLFLASWKSLSGLELFRAMGFFNVVSAFSFPYLAARIIGFFVSGSRRIFWSTLISIAGLESASWIAVPIVLARALTGEVKGFAEIDRMMSVLRFDGPNMMHTLTPYGSAMVNLSDKFITITSFSYSLDLFLIAFILFLSHGHIRKSRAASAVLLFVSILGSFLFHVIIGTALVCTLVGAGVLTAAARALFSRGPSGLYPLIMPSAAAVAAAAAGLPYLASLGGTETGGESFLSEYLHFGLRNLFTLSLPLLILFCPARKAAGRIFSFARDEHILAASWIIPLLALNLLVDLPTGNEDKLIFPLFLIIGPMVCIEITGIIEAARGARKNLLIAWTAFLFLVPPALTFYAFIDYRAEEAGIEERYRAFRGDRTFFETVRGRTGPRAIVAEKGFDHLMPVFAGRRSLAGEMLLHYVYGYDEDFVAGNFELNKDLFACKPFSEKTIDRLESFDFELYVAVSRRDMENCPLLASKFEEDRGLFELVHAGEEGRLYLLTGSAGSGGGR